MSLITADQLRKAAPSANPKIVDAIASHADDVFTKYKLTTLARVWGFMSVTLEETGGLKVLTEGLNTRRRARIRFFPSCFRRLSPRPLTRIIRRLSPTRSMAGGWAM